MGMRAKWLWMMVGVLLAAVVCGAGPAKAGAQADYSVEDQGWLIVEQEGERLVELRSLITNSSEEPLTYEVRFIIEAQVLEPAPEEATEPAGATEDATTPSEPEWSLTKTVPVRGGPLAPGASEVVKATFPYEELVTGQVYRFRVQLVDASSGALLAGAAITAAKAAGAAAAAAGAAAKVLAAAGAAVAIGGGLGGGGGEEAPVSVSGSGTMTGQHESHRVGDAWVEQGSGTIEVTCPQGHMVLNYSYNASGPSAESLTAVATATGTLTPSVGAPLAVEISSASSQVTQPGAREQVGQVVTRTGALATGTFSGTVGGSPWTGVITMTEGVMTLDLDTDTGAHEFQVQFTAGH
jgi:hypothetical protein